ncbi:hypothetical protein ACFY2Q_09175 [Micromonospora sp. NPDC000316]|uniref:hypothetical protein n=1 Tax=Micromonospora sp. NPDC000316 TaxID=3364216 RepID=UPI0036C3E103
MPRKEYAGSGQHGPAHTGGRAPRGAGGRGRGRPGSTEGRSQKLTVALVIWLVAFPVWETLLPRRPKR